MDNDHGITRELREWMNDNYPAWMKLRTGVSDQLDRIDAEHEKAIQREHESAYDKGYDEGFASADDWLAQHEDAMAELGWVRLPKDADGKYIHIGDEMETLISPFAGEHCAVEYLILSADGWEVDGDAPTSMRHYRKPTVEDVLREFFSRYVTTKPKDEDDAIIAEYAAKLQLKEEA